MFIWYLNHSPINALLISSPQSLMEIQLNLDLQGMLFRLCIYLGVKAHCILGGFVEFRVFEHVLFPAGALEDAKSQRRQSRKDLINTQSQKI